MNAINSSTRDPDLLVIGAGPAGMKAARTAADLGLRTVIVDEAEKPGGQVYRARSSALPDQAPSADALIGNRLRHDLEDSAAQFHAMTRVWFAAPGFTVSGLTPEGPVSWAPKSVIVASGTSERVVPMPGATLPGVIGLAAATILLKAHQVIPGERIVVAGAGPLLAAVAAGVIKGGGRVEAIADLASRGEWLRRFGALVSRPDLMRQGMAWLAQIRKAGTPIYHRHTVAQVFGTDRAESVTIVPIDSDGRPNGEAGRAIRLECDALAIGHGLVPATELTRLMGAKHAYERAAGGWIVLVDGDQQTSVDGLFAAGDGTGITGAAAAALEGELAAFSAARHLGQISDAEFRSRTAALRRHLKRAARFGAAMGNLMAMRDGLIDHALRDTLICRCEDIARGEIEDAVDDGVRTLNQLKSSLRCGMGPCQGRMCSEAAATIIAQRSGSDRANVGQWTARAPIRPVQLAEVIGDYSYDDIPRPPPAPA